MFYDAFRSIPPLEGLIVIKILNFCSFDYNPPILHYLLLSNIHKSNSLQKYTLKMFSHYFYKHPHGATLIHSLASLLVTNLVPCTFECGKLLQDRLMGKLEAKD